MKDLYKILNVQKTADHSEIKKSYRKLAFQYHPDKNSSDEAALKFREISEAYEILTNDDKRRLYDNFGYDVLQQEGQLTINPLELFQSLFNVDFTNLGEQMNSNIFVFSDLSSGPFGNLKHKMTYDLELTLEELYHGTQKEFQIEHLTHKGIKSTKYIINVKKGSKDGDNIVVKEGGNYRKEFNLTEDLVIQIKELEHPKYKRKKDDLYMEEKITLSEALTGVELHIDHLDGPLSVKITDIVKPNQMFQIFNKGMPIKHNEKSLTEGEEDKYGNLIIDLILIFPDSLSEKQMGYLKKILVQLEREKKEGQLVQAYYYKEKEEVLKELMNEKEDDNLGCIQQ